MPDILTYDQLINETDSEKVYLAEIEPALKMTGWQLAPGQTNTYQAAVDAGMAVCRLKEEKTDLVQKQSVAEVEANPGSWFFDPAAEILYAHSSDSASPDSHYMTAYFLETFATHPRVFNNRFYQPKIALIPEFRRSVNEKSAGNTIQSSGRLAMLEDSAQPYWSQTLYKYNWLNKRVTLKLGGAHEDYPYSEFKTVARWILKGNTYTDTGVEFEVADLKNIFMTRIGLNRYDTATYPNMDPAAEGGTIQIAFGQIANARAVLIDSATGVGGKWKLSLFAVNSIDAVYDDGTPAPFTADLANGEFTLNAAAQGLITADFTGLKDGANYLRRGGEISKYILLNLLSLPASDIVAADFDALDAARPYTLGIYIERATRADEILSAIEKSNHSFFYTDRATGAIRTQVFADPDNADPQRVLLNNDNLFDFQVETDRNIAHEINVSYGRDFASGESKFIRKTSLGSAYINDSEESVSIDTYLANKADAEVLGDILLPFYSRPRILAQATTHIRPLDRNLFDNVEANRNQRPALPDQQYTYRLLGSRERAAKDKKRVTLTLSKNIQPGEAG
ncbi:MAG: hypothetical protein ACE5GQ_04385 [Nitrospinales bacterium]